MPTVLRPEFDSLKRLLLDMARERSLEGLLAMVVRRLADRPPLALARIWLVGAGDRCGACRMAQECPDHTSCLHLSASAGKPIAVPEAEWSRLEGESSRLPIGAHGVGRVAARRESVIVRDMERETEGIARPGWARRERIEGFVGQPILHRGQPLGVIAVFPRIPVVDEGITWLRIIADHLGAAIANARAFGEIERLKGTLEMENEYLREEILEAHAFGDLVGRSPALSALERQIELVAPTDASVLILGESGTGKELVAREIHRRSKRRKRPMVRVNCASVPRELYESEFFGHAKGAFTGAVRERAGRFELAHGGTLFLDEVGEIPLELQSKLLRVLQEGQYERLGEEVTREVDVRIVAASNRDLHKGVEEGRFRQDLYYRLNVFPIQVSPLRERKEDIPPLAAHFLERSARKLNCNEPRLTQANLIALQRYDWPGNVRELQNLIERAVITSRCGALRFELPDPTPGSSSRISSAMASEDEVLSEVEMRRREAENLRRALDRTGWKVYGAGGAADLLGIKPTTMASRIKKLGLRRTTSG